MKRYKQYCSAHDAENVKILSALAFPQAFLFEDLFETDGYSYAREDFLPMRITFLEPDTQAPSSGFVFTHDELCQHPELSERYVQAVKGDLPDCAPIMVLLSEQFITFLVAAFLECGSIETVSDIKLARIPAGAQIRVEIGPDPERNGLCRTYLITDPEPDAPQGRQYRIACYLNGVLNTMRRFGVDEKGAYEWITEP